MAVSPVVGAYNVPPGPSVSAFAITPNNSTVFPPTRAIWVGGAGSVAVMMNGDIASVVLAAVPAGTMLPVSVKQVLATGTTATNIVGLT